jgi:hypothetical protein
MCLCAWCGQCVQTGRPGDLCQAVRESPLYVLIAADMNKQMLLIICQ